MAEANPSSKGARSQGATALFCVGVVLGMAGLSYAAVPLYRAFCQATGFGGTTQRGVAAPGAVGAEIFTVRFDANVAPGLPWTFTPAQRDVTAKPGEQKLAFYRARSESARQTGGQAVFNVTPDIAGQYFRKIACFCFNEQFLAPGQAVDMPVTFYLDPEILKDPDLQTIRTITLSYTFYPAPSGGTAAAAPQAKASEVKGAPESRVRIGLAPAEARSRTN